ncbi:uncharacterized protein LOC142345747 [Convolutriloba macropyga]|uniref:uncharacterized protein LOC142345747 n=1 Tax=Convolutriloba macropyga TaxID=536237 RepID=UPI003F523BBE
MYTFNSYPLFTAGAQASNSQLKPNFIPGNQNKSLGINGSQITPPGVKTSGGSLDHMSVQGFLKSSQTSPHNGTITPQFPPQTHQLLANSLTSTRIGHSLASAVLLRSMTQASQAAVSTTTEHSRLFPYFMTHPGSTSGQIGDFSGSPSGALNGFLNPYSLLQEEPKPNHSYIGLIAMAILNSTEKKLVLSDIYQYILDNYPYFRTRGPGWRNSIRHNLSLNDCFVKAGRSANGKGHFWAIHPACRDDFAKGDFRRRHAQRKVRKAMGLAVADDESDGNRSPSPVAAQPSGSQFSPIKFQFQHSTDRDASTTFKLPGQNSTIPTFPSQINSSNVGKFDSHLGAKGQKREHNDDNDTDTLNSSNISSDISPSKFAVKMSEPFSESENEITAVKLTPPMKKRQKRCFRIDSLLSPDVDSKSPKSDDEHENDKS